MKKIINKYEGTLMGLAVGDVLGAPFEFWRKEKINEYLQHNKLTVKQFSRGDKIFPIGFYTDDTAQMICLAESLLAKDFDLKDQYQRYYKWFTEGYATPDNKCYGVGQQTMRSLLPGRMMAPKEMHGQNEQAGGNGSLMRCAPIGLYYQNNYNLIEKYSLLASYVTHNNLIAGWTNVVLNTLISLNIIDVDKANLLNEVLKKYPNCPVEIKTILQLDYSKLTEKDLTINGYSLNTLKIALWSFLTTDTFADCLKQVILLGSDTDTFAAVAGALAGSYYGYDNIPAEWKDNIINKDRILNLSREIYTKQFVM